MRMRYFRIYAENIQLRLDCPLLIFRVEIIQFETLDRFLISPCQRHILLFIMILLKLELLADLPTFWHSICKNIKTVSTTSRRGGSERGIHRSWNADAKLKNERE